jgi:hypothetical protein
MKSPEQHTKQPNQGNKPYHTKASPKNKRKHTNRRRQMFFNSTNQPPTPVPTRNPPRLATRNPQSMTSQQNSQNEYKTKGGGGKQRQNHLQHKIPHIPPITKLSSCPLCCPISPTEANHRLLLTEFADWVKHNKKPKRAPIYSTSPTTSTHRYVTQNHRTSTNNESDLDPTVCSSTKRLPSFTTDSSPFHETQQNHHHKHRPPTMPTDTIADACMLLRHRNAHSSTESAHTWHHQVYQTPKH